MQTVDCPHCKAQRIITSSTPKDVVVVMQCPACHELVVLFRGKAIALNRRIIEQGTIDERKAHLAEVIVEFLEAGDFLQSLREGRTASPLGADHFLYGDADEADAPAVSADAGEAVARAQLKRPGPITSEEIDHFLQMELKGIGDASYFKKHFG